jgi:hypothetical protein
MKINMHILIELILRFTFPDQITSYTLADAVKIPVSGRMYQRYSQLVKKLSACMGHKGLLPCPEKPTIRPSPEPVELSLHSYTVFLRPSFSVASLL